MPSILATLKLSSAKRTSQVSPAMQRRAKITKRLAEQIDLAKAMLEDRSYTAFKLTKVVDQATGQRTTVQVPKRLKEWYFFGDNNKLYLTIRYGAVCVELAKGKTAIEIADRNDLVSTLESVATAINNGELDTQLEIASSAVKTRFKN